MRRELRFERRRQHGDPVLGPLAVPHEDLVVGEVDVLDPQAERLGQAHPRSVEKGEEEPVVSLKMREDALDLFLRENHRQFPPPPGSDESLQLSHLSIQNRPVQEEQCAQSLGLGRGAHPMLLQ